MAFQMWESPPFRAGRMSTQRSLAVVLEPQDPSDHHAAMSPKPNNMAVAMAASNMRVR